MAESICRALRDGVLEGEQAPALTIKDSAASPFGVDVFTYILIQLSSNIMAGKSQSQSLRESEVEKGAHSSKQLHAAEQSGRGEIIYFRDSDDDEMPDSDEDPDDDLDI